MDPARFVELHAQDPRLLGERNVFVVAEERAPPLAVLVLEEHVVPAVGDGQGAIASRAGQRVGAGDHAMVLVVDELRARQVVPALDLEYERRLKAHMVGVGRLEQRDLSARPLRSSFKRAILPS